MCQTFDASNSHMYTHSHMYLVYTYIFKSCSVSCPMNQSHVTCE